LSTAVSTEPIHYAPPVSRLIPGTASKRPARKSNRSVGTIETAESAFPPKEAAPAVRLRELLLPSPMRAAGEGWGLFWAVASDYLAILASWAAVWSLTEIATPSGLAWRNWQGLSRPLLYSGNFRLGLMFAVTTTLLAYSEGVYRSVGLSQKQTRALLKSAALSSVTVWCIAGGMGSLRASTGFAGGVALSVATLFARRRIRSKRKRAGERNKRNVLIVGAGRTGRAVASYLSGHPEMGRSFRGFLDHAGPGALGRPQKVRVAFIGARGVIGRYSGIEGYYEEVGRRLARAGHEVTVHCRSYFTPAQDVHNGMRLVRLPTIRSKHLETAVHTLLASVHVLFQPCDVVHYHAFGPSLFSFLPRLAGKETVVTVQGLDWQRKKWSPIAAWVLRLGERAAVRLPGRTMVVSRTLQSYYKKRFGAETIYVPNGTLLRERREVDRIRQWELDTNQYILFLGRFSPEKNCHLLIEAYERLDTNVRLVLAGGARAFDVYAESLRQHQSERVILLDYVSGDTFEELLTNARLFVLPSDLEGLSLALLEAMGAGLCVLASDIPENRELVDGAGFLFEPGSVIDLERMLRFLLSDESARARAGQRARQRVQQEYLWPAIAAQVEAVYFDVLRWKLHPNKSSRNDRDIPLQRKPVKAETATAATSPSRRAG
jgi:glycosyltransferase involved in cell wall biosynthesis